MLLSEGIPFGFIFNKIRIELLVVTIYAVIIAVIDENKLYNVLVSPTVPAILGTALSLLLGFRTNQSYQRWWEARIVWGAIVNDSRTLLRQLLTFARGSTNDLAPVRQRMAYRQAAFCYALGQSLRRLDAVAPIRNLISDEELRAIQAHDNLPNALLMQHGTDLSDLLERKQINPFQQVQMDATLRRLCDSMGKCERIKNTVFPSAYNLIIYFFLYMFVASLPFALVESFGLGQIPIVVGMAAIFFLIEKSAIYLQDPFENKPTDTPMTAIARTIEINLRQMIADDHVPPKPVPEEYYLM